MSGMISKRRFLFDVAGESLPVARYIPEKSSFSDAVYLSRETFELVYPWCECDEVQIQQPQGDPTTAYVLARFTDSESLELP
jgi:hypothetical protein